MISDRKKLYAGVLRECGDDRSNERIVEEMIAVESLLRELTDIDSELDELKRQHATKLRVLWEKRKAIRARCKHWSTTYYPDASGNNDSETLCDVCGAEIPKRPRG